jgi:hypothetical protein
MMDERKPESPPVPAPLEVEYFSQFSHPLLKIIRSIGVLAVTYGTIGLVLIPMHALYREAAQRASPTPQTLFMFVNELLSVWVNLILSVCVISAGIGFLRRKPKGRGLMLGWAWASLSWIAYIVLVTAGYFLLSPYRRYTVQQIVYTYYYELRIWVSGLLLPLIVIFLLRHETLRGLFTTESKTPPGKPF